MANVLTREQLNELLDMNEVKKLIKQRRRSNQPMPVKKTLQKQKEEMLKLGSGLVFESHSIAKTIKQKQQDKMRRFDMKVQQQIRTDEGTCEGDGGYMKRKSIMDGDLDGTS